MTKKYRQTLDYLFAQLPMFHRIGPAAFKNDLSNTLAFCKYLGNPEQKFPSIHIAGTNGKGSVAHFLAAIFTARGLKTGLYTSPHYRDFRERIKIDGTYIPENEVVSFVEEHKHFSEAIKPSFFEWTVALAFDYFAKQKVDIAIIETGMGGRLDSTNVVTPLLSIITNISFDHQQFLGDTLPLIAGEKAGIIKPGIPVVIGQAQPETKPVFEEKARAENAPIYFADKHWEAVLEQKTRSHSFYSVYKNGDLLHRNFPLEHLAGYQKKNLATVFQAVELLDNQHPFLVPNGNNSLSEGLKNLQKYAGLIGRWDVRGERPTIIFDSAHNEDGVRLAMESLKNIPKERLHFILGMVNDKDPGKLLSMLPKEAVYYFAKADIPRGLDAKILQEAASKYGLIGKTYSSVKKAFSAAKMSAKEADLIFVGGSIFVVAEVV